MDFFIWYCCCLKGKFYLLICQQKKYPITDAFDSIKALSQVINPGFGYFGRLHLMPEVLGNVHIGFMNVLKLRTGFVFKSISPPNFIINF